jgi:type II secretory pathway component GspD/PulD (secretin)
MLAMIIVRYQLANPSIAQCWRSLVTGLCLSAVFVGGWLSVNSSAQEPAPAAQPPSDTPAAPAVDGSASVAVPAGAVPAGDIPPGAIPPGAVPPGATPAEATPPGATPPGTAAPGATPASKLPPPVTRASLKPGEANPDELKVRPREDGTIEFQFRNQPWPGLLQWLAEICSLSLDWQELPGDQLNLATQRPYTLVEARDLINRHLLLRGYTMLESDGVLTVTKTDAINVALVPRVEPTELATLPPARFVRTSVPILALDVAALLEEIKPMLSANGKAHALKATNRLELMDCAINLREIYAILQQEQSPDALQSLAREFVLEHIRAMEAKELLEIFLGLSKPEKSAAVPPEMAQMQMQMQMQAQMMEQQAAAQNPAAGAKKDKDLNIVANIRLNSLIVHAPAEKMALIASFVKRIDSPTPVMDLAMLGTKMKVYRLESVDPEQLISSLIQMDALEPQTKLQVDKDNQAIIVYGSIADHYVIQQVLERLDGSGREFEVVQLRRLRADEVAGTIQFLMVPKEEDTKKNDPYGGFFFGFSPPGDDKDKKPKDKFRVSANLRDNQVLLWANETELDEVKKLLVKLGEIAPESGGSSMFRSIPASSSRETFEYLQQLKNQWESISDVPLEIPSAEAFEEQLQTIDAKPSESDDNAPKETPPANEKQPEEPAKPGDSETPSPPTTSNNDQQTRPPAESPVDPIASSSDEFVRPASMQRSSLVSTDDNQNNELSSSLGKETAELDNIPPQSKKIQITIDEQGQLKLFSSDPRTLDQLEEIMIQNPPPKKQFDVFRVQWARASWIKLSLEEYFREQSQNDKENDELNGFLSFLIYDELRPKDDSSAQLGKRKPVRFIADNDTSSIIAIGADEAEKQTIRELIRIWDVPEPTNSSNTRFTKLVRIKYSRAEVIAEAIKDAYRDLLSANDRAFQQQNGQGATVGGGENKRSEQNENATVSSSGGLNFAFKGELSVGVDKTTNTLIVSAKGKDLLEIISGVVEELDELARPQGTTRVVPLTPEMSNKALEKALRAMMQQERQEQQEKEQSVAPQVPQTPLGTPAAGNSPVVIEG